MYGSGSKGEVSRTAKMPVSAWLCPSRWPVCQALPVSHNPSANDYASFYDNEGTIGNHTYIHGYVLIDNKVVHGVDNTRAEDHEHFSIDVNSQSRYNADDDDSSSTAVHLAGALARA